MGMLYWTHELSIFNVLRGQESEERWERWESWYYTLPTWNIVECHNVIVAGEGATTSDNTSFSYCSNLCILW